MGLILCTRGAGFGPNFGGRWRDNNLRREINAVPSPERGLICANESSLLLLRLFGGTLLESELQQESILRHTFLVRYRAEYESG